MTQDEIIRLAREAGFYIENWSFGERVSVYESGKTIDITNELKDFAALVAAHEREALAEQTEQEPVKVTGAMVYAFHHALTDAAIGAGEFDEIKLGLEAAFVNITTPTEPVKQEPVARVSGYYGGRCVVEPLNRATVLPTDMALYAATVQQVTRADLKAAFKEGFERAADLYAPNDGQEPYAYEVWDVQDQSFTMIYATQLKEFHWIEPENIARVLYAAPVRTKDLTDEELWEAAKTAKSNDLTDAFRAVIAADRELNK